VSRGGVHPQKGQKVGAGEPPFAGGGGGFLFLRFLSLVLRVVTLVSMAV